MYIFTPTDCTSCRKRSGLT